MKTKQCPNCSEVIPKGYYICPKCNKELALPTYSKSTNTLTIILLGLVVFAIFLIVAITI